MSFWMKPSATEGFGSTQVLRCVVLGFVLVPFGRGDEQVSVSADGTTRRVSGGLSGRDDKVNTKEPETAHRAGEARRRSFGSARLR